MEFLGNGTETIDIQFNATAPIEALKIFAPNWIAPAGSEHELNLNYTNGINPMKTIAGSPIAVNCSQVWRWCMALHAS